MNRYVVGMAVLLLLAPAGCTRARYKKKADREAYGIIAEKSRNVAGMSRDFTIEQEETFGLSDLPGKDATGEFLGEVGKSEQGARVFSLEKALSIAVQRNRTYQREKELLYIEALSLTLDRHRYAPIFSAGGDVAYNRFTQDIEKTHGSTRLAQYLPGWIDAAGDAASLGVTNVGTAGDLAAMLPAGTVPPIVTQTLQATGAAAGTSATLLRSYADVVESAFTATGLNQPQPEIMNERTVDGTARAGVDLLLKGGGRLALSISSTFLRYFTGDPRVGTDTLLEGSFVQPLLRGRGKTASAEALTQAELNVLYQLRDFVRFRKEFAVQVASEYYRVLQNREIARNRWKGYQAFQTALARQRALAEAGRVTQADLGRSEQATLSAEANWIRAVRVYTQTLDELKILLGLSTDAAVVLDDDELRRLQERGIVHFPMSAEDAARVAMAARLDLYTARDVVGDSARRLEVAANGLLPDLNLFLTGDVRSDPGDDRFNTLDFQRARWSLGFDTDLPFDRKSERNNYRVALIDFERSQRELSLTEDNVKLQVREIWRNREEAMRTFQIRSVEVDLNGRRVQEQDLLAELGRATALDQIDAQNDLVDARDQLTAALVDHTIAGLSLWRDMGILFIKEDGRWEEVTEVRQNPDTAAPGPVDQVSAAETPPEASLAEGPVQ
jgi:outer membrane protein TolC